MNKPDRAVDDPDPDSIDEQRLLRWVKPEAPQEIRDLILNVVSKVTRVSSSYRGPLPTAEEFRKYNEVQEDAAHRILQMAERAVELQGEDHKVARRRINASTAIAFGMILLTAFGMGIGLGPIVIIPLGLSGVVSLFLREILKLLGRH